MLKKSSKRVSKRVLSKKVGFASVKTKTKKRKNNRKNKMVIHQQQEPPRGNFGDAVAQGAGFGLGWGLASTAINTALDNE